MASRSVRARPREGLMSELRERLDEGEIERLDPFGRAMTTALEDARFDPGPARQSGWRKTILSLFGGRSSVVVRSIRR